MGKSNISLEGLRSRKRKLTNDADMEPRAGKYRRTDETQKIVAGRDNSSRTTRSKKRKLPTDNDAREPQLKIEEKTAGETNSPRTRSRKRQK